MKEKPIIFSADMVRAILDGRKTMTRRVIKEISPEWDINPVMEGVWAGEQEGLQGAFIKCQTHVDASSTYFSKCPFQVKQKLWVRETWQHVPDENAGYIIYGADFNDGEYESLKPWKPSIFMPREASRITLEVTEVRVERVQEITSKDAVAEGWPGPGHDMGELYWFEKLWDSINARSGFPWEANPRVWVITFKQVNVDE